MYHIAFVCLDNSCRSQMAEGWLHHWGRGHIQVFSAGILLQPIHPFCIEVMRERNIDISHYMAKNLFTLALDRLTHLITVCNQARDLCPPSLPGISLIHWSIPNPLSHLVPVEERLEAFRTVRDQINDLVQALIPTLL